MLEKAGDQAYFFVRVILEMLDITDREDPADKGNNIVGFHLNIHVNLDRSISARLRCTPVIYGKERIFFIDRIFFLIRNHSYKYLTTIIAL